MSVHIACVSKNVFNGGFCSEQRKMQSWWRHPMPHSVVCCWAQSTSPALAFIAMHTFSFIPLHVQQVSMPLCMRKGHGLNIYEGHFLNCAWHCTAAPSIYAFVGGLCLGRIGWCVVLHSFKKNNKKTQHLYRMKNNVYKWLQKYVKLVLKLMLPLHQNVKSCLSQPLVSLHRLKAATKQLDRETESER